MAVQRRLHTEMHKVKDTITTSDGRQTLMETWHGKYEDLLAKQAAVKASAKATNLTPNGATSSLTITYETPAPTTAEFSGSETITEVIWREGRLPIEQNKLFETISTEKIQKVKDDVEQGLFNIYDTSEQTKLRDFLLKGISEYSVGVPVVRRTRTKKSGSVGGGRAWYADNPPVRVAGTWTWIKTADERRRDGNTYTQVEEWTGNHAAIKELY